MVQALVPLKDLVDAKSRLAGLLRPSERRALAQAMAEDVLSALRNTPAVARITLVSDDPVAALLAQKYEAECWTEASLGCRGLNALIGCATGNLMRETSGPLLVLHADLPLLAPLDIVGVLARQREIGGLVIGCDRQGSGTNLLAFDAAGVPQFSFGADSCARHLAAARRAGITAEVMRSAGIASDVDEARDLRYVLGQLSGRVDTHTARLLRETRWGARVGAALASMSGQSCGEIAVNRGTTG